MIKAIETHYAGCRFRSRLEARWAVFFDAIGIEWQYEPEGYVVSTWGDETRPYLPDFYLPQTETWVEIKGDIEALDFDLLAHTIDWGGALPGVADSLDTTRGLLLLGPIPEVKLARAPIHPILQHHKGGSVRGASFVLGPSRLLTYDLNEAHDYFDSTWGVPKKEDGWCQTIRRYFPGTQSLFGNRRGVAGAYEKARKARFEHGEKG